MPEQNESTAKSIMAEFFKRNGSDKNSIPAKMTRRINFLPGEKEAIIKMIQDAEKYGYGNFIAWLRRAWADKLMCENKFPERDALKATENVTAYPFGYSDYLI